MKKIYISSLVPIDILNELKRHGFYPILLPESTHLQKPVAAHADMLVHRLGKDLLCAKYYAKENPDVFIGDDVILTEEAHHEQYPYDILFNCFEYKNTLYGRLQYLSEYIKKYCTERKMSFVDLKQGYAKCSCIVTPEVCITDDESVARSVEGCVKIRREGIRLPGYSGGFIGGASFYHNGTVYFFGGLGNHPDGEIIRKTLTQVGIGAVELSKEQLIDLGGAVF